MRRRKADVRVLEQYLCLCLQTLAQALESRTEGQVSELFDHIFDHSLRNWIDAKINI
jgi:hypothetical protein